MEKWVGTIIGAVFIVALGYAVYIFFGGKSLTSSSNSSGTNGLIGRMGYGIEQGCDKVLGNISTINPAHFAGVWAGFVNVLASVAE